MKERKFIEQGMKKIQLEQYLKKQLNRAGFTGLHMVKTPLVTRIVLNVARPGLAIGKGGQNIRQITDDIEKKFGIDNPQIEIQDIKNPTLDSKATVEKMVELIERGYSWKSVTFRTVREITEAGAQGVELVLKGKLSGKGGRKRKHRVIQGYMKKVGDQVKLVDTAKASAYPKAGAIGLKLSIIRPEVVFPDKVKISDALKAKEEAEEGEETKTENAGEQEKEAQGKKEIGEKKEKEEKKDGKEKAVKEKTGKKGKAGKKHKKEAEEKPAKKDEEKKEKSHAKKGEEKKKPVKEENKEKKVKEEKKTRKEEKEKKDSKEEKKTRKEEKEKKDSKEEKKTREKPKREKVTSGKEKSVLKKKAKKKK
jgi:small subunit ribosomal protein S3